MCIATASLVPVRMIVQVDVVDVPIAPAEDETPLKIHTNGAPAFKSAAQLLKVVAERNAQVSLRAGIFKQLELAKETAA